jgi:DNA-binding transcriptional LysR family regulator
MDSMEIRQLQIFRALAEELHFTRAAARVHCVQSNVTTQIRSLEEELGTPLFDRLAKRVVLTDAGRRFLPYAEKVLSTLDEAHCAMVQDAAPAGPLSVGAPESVLTYRLPGILSEFRKLYPKVALTFRPYNDEKLIHSLEIGKFDLAVWMVDSVESERLKFVRLRSEEIFLFASPEHPFAAKKKIEPQDLSGQTLLLTEAGCGYRKKLDQLLALQGIRPGNITEFSSVEAIRECVSMGMGLGLLPEVVIAEEMARKRVVALPWAGPPMAINTYVVWHKDKWVSPALRAFVSLLEKRIAGKTHAATRPVAKARLNSPPTFRETEKRGRRSE